VKPFIGLVTLILLGSAIPSFALDKDPVHQVTDQIICPCSCGEVLTGCICETGVSMKGTVENGVKAGKSKKAIVDGLVAQYGEVIRGAPKPEGFNLIVWIAPFLATLAGFAIAFMVLRRMVQRRKAAAVVVSPSAPGTIPFPTARALEAEAEGLRERAEAELRELKQGS